MAGSTNCAQPFASYFREREPVGDDPGRWRGSDLSRVRGDLENGVNANRDSADEIGALWVRRSERAFFGLNTVAAPRMFAIAARVSPFRSSMQSTRTLAFLFVFSLFLATGMQAAAGYFNKSQVSVGGDFSPDDQRPFDSPDEIPI